jgi:hypothetical protein
MAVMQDANHACLATRALSWIAMLFLQRVVAVWLLAAFGACYAFPVTTRPTSRLANCCRRPGHNGSCCPKTSETGSFWTAAADCAQGCRLPAGLTVHASPLVAPGSTAAYALVRSETPLPQNAGPAGFSFYFAFVYQRPPPPSL